VVLRDEDPFARPEPKPLKLDEFSISELQERIEGLQAEIARCEALIARKKAAADIASSVFGRSGG
jgi:uncharacterized small protein (DUF1192 family)